MVKCKNVKKRFSIQRGILSQVSGYVNAVDGVTLAIKRGQSYGIVGESGCGKTTLGKLILGILKPDSGEIVLDTKRVQVIFQDPQNSLDPKMRMSEIIGEGLAVSCQLPVAPAWAGTKGGTGSYQKKIKETLDLVRLPQSALTKFPHQFSGGERQRIAIARAVITEPEFIVCDEPVSSLDVTVQLQILNLLKDIQKKFSITYLFISHDLRVVRFMCDRVAVMRDGRILEEGETKKVYSHPANDYTRLLLNSILGLNQEK